MVRTYDMSKRAAAASETASRITDATEKLLISGPVGDVTLQAIADGAAVTVQTVLRHMGSRDGCFEAVGVRLQARVDQQRGHTPPGDVDAAISGLLDHYETDGRLVLNLLLQEGMDSPLAREAAQQGRAYHRAWVERGFGPLLPDRRRGTVDALVAATDISVWKLLRLDLGRSRSATQAVITRTVQALLAD